jgi:RNA polymerase-binding protein DksA
MALSKPRLSKLTTSLDRRYASLLEEVRDALEKSENQQYVALIDGSSTDIADESIADALADLSLAIIDRHIQEMRDIEAARARIKDGSFGICIDCGTEISSERLVVNATAKRCVTCQRQREKTYAHGGFPTL